MALTGDRVGACIVVAGLCGCIVGCGGAHGARGGLTGQRLAPAARSVEVARSYRNDDGDVDDEGGKDDAAHIPDDYRITKYGRPADAADRLRISALVRRYSAAAAATDGGTACRLMGRRLADAPGRNATLPENPWEWTPRVYAARGERCLPVAVRVFRADRSTFVKQGEQIEVSALRTHGSHGLAILSFKTMPERWMPVVREGGGWKIASFRSREIP